MFPAILRRRRCRFVHWSSLYLSLSLFLSLSLSFSLSLSLLSLSRSLSLSVSFYLSHSLSLSFSLSVTRQRRHICKSMGHYLNSETDRITNLSSWTKFPPSKSVAISGNDPLQKPTTTFVRVFFPCEDADNRYLWRIDHDRLSDLEKNVRREKIRNFVVESVLRRREINSDTRSEHRETSNIGRLLNNHC